MAITTHSAKSLFIALLVSLFFPLPLLAQDGTTPAGVAPRADKSYRLGPGDLLDIRVFNRPELTREVRVNETGGIRLPFIEELTAACLTESELARQVAEKYRKYMLNPQVDVFIKEYGSQPVAVIGAVAKPGRFQLQRRVRLLELLTYAGGPSEKAGRTVHVIHNEEHVYCKTDGEPEAAPPALAALQLKDIMAGAPAANPYVAPGDTISLPEAEVIFVTGSVIRPGPLPLQNKLTLSQALAMAGGVTEAAARKRVRLIRQEENGARVERVFNLEDIEKRNAEDLVLRANDVIDVPGARGIGRSLLQAFVPTAAQLPLFVIRTY